MDDLEIRSNEAPTGPTPHGKALTWEPDVLGKTELSFRLVEPAALSVEGLNVQIDIAPSAWNTVKARFTKGIDAHPRQKSRRKTILSDITAHMPSGTLTAIIGASGSGKTSLRPHSRAVMSALNYCSGLSSTPSRIGPVVANSRPPEAFGITGIPTY